MQILDQAIMSYSFNLKTNKESSAKEGKLSLGVTFPKEDRADCILHIEIETPDYEFKGEFAYHFEKIIQKSQKLKIGNKSLWHHFTLTRCH